ncbi:serine/threonine protein kinase [Mycobacterium kansasii]|uniref:serine/threonine-protein kinase PknD n=1 Tax=Mycobacterium kansasii TaxID=1768 RepID=UPI000CDE2695|nr:serine/threonine-protein kinase PknD [Mycobacterium kansasii]POX98785.1 serine/threonine protein kinase [Mycobacterium kansasii]POY24367.1 serine/threonine protein kinase [Mycobacterium kansasii]
MDTVFGRYQLIEVIGEGAMGKVYRARDTKMRREVAVKVLAPELATEPGYRERFRREAYGVAQLNEPHVIPIHEADEIDGQLYLVMPVVDGTDVQALLNRDGHLTPELTVTIVEQVAVALDAAHEQGLVHRDVKPSNLLITDDEFVYLIDFGIARGEAAPKLTYTGSILGTWGYMAPERFTDGTNDACVDIYALACVLYECLTGQLPFSGETLEQQFTGHTTQDPPRPTDVKPELPAGFDEVIARGLAKDPDQRYPTARDLAAAARQVLDDASELGPCGAARTPNSDAAAPAEPQRPGATPDTSGTAEKPARSKTVTPPPSQATPAWHRRRPWQLGGAAAALVIAVVGVGAIAGNPTAHPVSQVAGASEPLRPAPVVLPFTGLDGPTPVAVGPGGAVYVGDYYNNRVVQLASGSFAETELPFTGLNRPQSLAVDSTGTVYVSGARGEVLTLPAGAASASKLADTGAEDSAGLAVDTAGNVYVVDTPNNRVLKLPGGGGPQTVLPFTGLKAPAGVAVDSSGAVYVCDAYNNRVLKLPAGASTQIVLPFTELVFPTAVAVDKTGAVYVSDSPKNQILKLPAGADSQTVLPLGGLNHPEGVAVDEAGNVYVTDSNNNRVLKLAAH